MDAARFAERLKGLRERAGLTQKGLADKAGLNQSTIALLESGSREPGLSTFVAVCEALGVSCDVLLEEAGKASVESPAAAGVVGAVPPLSRPKPKGKKPAGPAPEPPAKKGRKKRG